MNKYVFLCTMRGVFTIEHLGPRGFKHQKTQGPEGPWGT